MKEKNNFVIRKAKKKDFAKFIKVDKEAWHNNYVGIMDYYDGTEKPVKSIEWDKEHFLYPNKEGKLSVFVAENNGEILGYVVLLGHLHRTWLEDILVRRKYQGKRVGTALVNYALKNKKRVFLTVNEKNKRAIKFFKKFGFKPILEDMLMMEKRF